MAIKADFSKCTIHVPGCWGVNCAVLKCKVGHAQHSLSCKLFMSEMSRKDLIELIAKQGYTADVDEDSGTGYVRITTEYDMPLTVKAAIEASLPAGVKASFITKSRAKIELPKSLQKWAIQTQKEMKKS